MIDDMVKGGKRSAWMSHVKKTMKANKGMKLMQVLKLAKKTYKKTGGGVAEGAGLVGARRRRRGGDPPATGTSSSGTAASSSAPSFQALAPLDDETPTTPPSQLAVRKAALKPDGGRKTRKSGRKSRGTRKH